MIPGRFMGSIPSKVESCNPVLSGAQELHAGGWVSIVWGDDLK